MDSSADSSKAKDPSKESSKTAGSQNSGLGSIVEESVLGYEDAIILHETHNAGMAVGTHDKFRCLALVAHNHMKPAMQDFVKEHGEMLKHFRLTGTHSTMTMLRTMLGEDAEFGPTCSSGPLGGDAEVMAQVHLEDLGGVMFFADPLDSHPHVADIEMTIRQTNLYNILHAPNPATALALTQTLKEGVKDHDILPSFTTTQMSPVIAVAIWEQRRASMVRAARLIAGGLAIMYGLPVAMGIEHEGWGLHHHIYRQVSRLVSN